MYYPDGSTTTTIENSGEASETVTRGGKEDSAKVKSEYSQSSHTIGRAVKETSASTTRFFKDDFGESSGSSSYESSHRNGPYGATGGSFSASSSHQASSGMTISVSGSNPSGSSSEDYERSTWSDYSHNENGSYADTARGREQSADFSSDGSSGVDETSDHSVNGVQNNFGRRSETNVSSSGSYSPTSSESSSDWSYEAESRIDSPFGDPVTTEYSNENSWESGGGGGGGGPSDPAIAAGAPAGDDGDSGGGGSSSGGSGGGNAKPSHIHVELVTAPRGISVPRYGVSGQIVIDWDGSELGRYDSNGEFRSNGPTGLAARQLDKAMGRRTQLDMTPREYGMSSRKTPGKPLSPAQTNALEQLEKFEDLGIRQIQGTLSPSEETELKRLGTSYFDLDLSKIDELTGPFAARDLVMQVQLAREWIVSDDGATKLDNNPDFTQALRLANEIGKFYIKSRIHQEINSNASGNLVAAGFAAPQPVKVPSVQSVLHNMNVNNKLRRGNTVANRPRTGK